MVRKELVFWNWRRGSASSQSGDMKSGGLIGAIVVGVCAGAGGYLVGKNSNLADGESRTAPQDTKSIAAGKGSSAGSSLARGEQEPNLRGFELSRNPKQGLETLIAELRLSPMAQMDFEALFGIWDMVQYLDSYELQGLMADLKEMGGGQEMMAVQMMLMNRWAAKDGEAAMTYAMEEQQGMMKMIGTMGVMMGWMRSDPEQAYAWVQENGDQLGGSGFGMGKEQLEAMYFASMAKTDFEGTMAKLDGMDSDMQEAVIEQMSQSYGLDVEKRTQLLDRLKAGGNEELIEKARLTMVSQMAWQDPKAALAFIDSENPSESERESLEQSATSMWAHTDPAGALEWKSSRLRGQENAGNEIAGEFATWLVQDETAAATWLQGQGEEFKTDNVFSQAGASLAGQENFERSASWYEQVLDSNERKGGYQSLYENWKQEDPAAADAWLRTLPATDKQWEGAEVTTE